MSKNVVGGQAVIEGVMMRNGEHIATAVRRPDGISVSTERFVPLSRRFRLLGYPFFRGVASLFEMLYLGTKWLIHSAHEAGYEDEEVTRTDVFLSVGIALVLSIGLFVLLPYAATYLVGMSENSQPLLFNLVDGLIKVAVLVGYIYLIGHLKDIKRVFEYHGAEHKSVHTFEKKKPLDPDHASVYPTEHARCGTSFLVIVILTGVVVFSLIPVILTNLLPQIMQLHPIARYSIYFAARLAMLPLIAGISYEWLRLSPQLSSYSFLKVLDKPGIWVQRLTTREPSKEQLEVAIAALKAVVPADSFTESR